MACRWIRYQVQKPEQEHQSTGDFSSLWRCHYHVTILAARNFNSIENTAEIPCQPCEGWVVYNHQDVQQERTHQQHNSSFIHHIPYSLFVIAFSFTHSLIVILASLSRFFSLHFNTTFFSKNVFQRCSHRGSRPCRQCSRSSRC